MAPPSMGHRREVAQLEVVGAVRKAEKQGLDAGTALASGEPTLMPRAGPVQASVAPSAQGEPKLLYQL